MPTPHILTGAGHNGHMELRASIQEVVLDCADPQRLARFWGELLGAPWGLVGDDWAVVRAEPILLAFQKVPEPKQSAKNRLHMDVEVADLGTWVQRAEALGARLLAAPVADENASTYQVMRDIEDNEFCFVTDPEGTWRATQLAALGHHGQ